MVFTHQLRSLSVHLDHGLRLAIGFYEMAQNLRIACCRRLLLFSSFHKFAASLRRRKTAWNKWSVSLTQISSLLNRRLADFSSVNWGSKLRKIRFRSLFGPKIVNCPMGQNLILGVIVAFCVFQVNTLFLITRVALQVEFVEALVVTDLTLIPARVRLDPNSKAVGWNSLISNWFFNFACHWRIYCWDMSKIV